MAAERRRCATYTRKSSEDGLDQDFNSLDAQREACEAFIRSQKSEGWMPVRKHYDDGGYSGGTLERPGLQQLLEDIEAGKIDTVVVYKVDRLTRSLTDFAKIVEVLDTHGASFVSVTQQFNTTTSMGRLTLNMLLSFAQFEREVTGERIRDKIAASKRKGLWMGGPIPLGYEPDGRTLVINPTEAETVRTVFRLYLELGTVRKVKAEADRLGLRTKIRTGADAHMRGGRPMSRGYIYHLLGNPLYIGRISHGDESFEGQHPAIIDERTWAVVQKQLAEQAPPPARQSGSTPSPLRGKLFDESGAVLTPKHTVKSGRRYRYYVSGIAGSTKSRSDMNPAATWRLPAREIERLVSRAVEALLVDPTEIVHCARLARIDDEQAIALAAAASDWTGSPLALVRRVELSSSEITLEIDSSQIASKIETFLQHRLPVHIRRRGVERKLILGTEQRSGAMDPALAKAVARSRRWFQDLASGHATSLLEIAQREGVSDRYIGNVIPLAFLAPDIVARILTGDQPTDLTAQALTKRISLPADWLVQRKLLGLG